MQLPSTEIKSLRSTQEETDTRVVLYLLYALEQGYKFAVVKSPDTDILIILLYYAAKFHPLVVIFDTGVGAHRRLINITELAQDLSPTYCEALLGLHCFTGEDCNCSFKGKGKLNPVKKMLKKPKYIDTFRSLGNSWEVSNQTTHQLEEFVCFLYGQQKVKSVDKTRSILLHKATGGKNESLRHVKKVDLGRMPPCKRSLLMHIRRANYRARQFKLSHVATPEIPPPSMEHGWNNQNQYLEPLWNEGPVLPETLNNLVMASDTDSDNDDIVSEAEEASFSSDCDSDID